jgi:LPXTG-site transpeptidase (sortase) family protein
MSQKQLGKINDVLTVIVIVLGLYIVVSPFIPAFYNWWQRNHSAPTALTQSVVSNTQPSNTVQGNRLSIPVMNLDEPVLDGATARTVNNGVWRLPNSATPGSGSNTVLVGHRYSYNPGIAHPFYSLDIVKVGDSVGVYWENRLYTYTVTEVKVVAPTALEIEAPTPYEQLTLYTCTPLWTSNQRLVIIAKPTGDIQ